MTTYKYQMVWNLILILLSLALASCGGVNSSAADPVKAAPGSFKVAMLLPGPIDDGAWSQSGYEGLQLIEKELGAQVAYTTSVPQEEEEIKKILRQYAEEGYDFIIGLGGEYIPSAEAVAEEFPRTKFAVTAGYPGNNKNLGGIGFREAEMAYLAGVVAALKTKTNKLAYIGGEAYPHTIEQTVLFERGAKTINPSIEVAIEWVESWSDPVRAKEIAQAQIASGADVLLAVVDGGDPGVFEAAENAGIYAIAWSSDLHDLAPKTILTSVVQRMPALVLEGATLVQQGRWEGKQYRFGLQEGVQDLAPFYEMLTSEEEAKVKAIRDDILIGKIDVLAEALPEK